VAVSGLLPGGRGGGDEGRNRVALLLTSEDRLDQVVLAGQLRYDRLRRGFGCNLDRFVIALEEPGGEGRRLLGAEMGIFALLAWVLLMSILVIELYSASKKAKDKAVSFLALGLIGSLVWYCAHSFFDDSIYAPNVSSMLVVIVSLCVLVIRYVKAERGDA